VPLFTTAKTLPDESAARGAASLPEAAACAARPSSRKCQDHAQVAGLKGLNEAFRLNIVEPCQTADVPT